MFIDALHDKTHELIHVAERVDGRRILKEYPARYVFYYPDSKGQFTDIGGRRMGRVMVSNAKAFDKERRVYYGQRLCESDYSPVNRCLEENYKGQEAPNLHVAFFDIEVAYDRVRGFAETNDPFNPITAITTHLGWLDRTVTFAVKPEGMTDEVAAAIVGHFEDTILCKDDAELLELWMGLIEDADVLSGWNSEGYDVPYVVNRIQRILSKDHTRQMCLWNQLPRRREFEKYGRVLETYDPIGRVHLDYLELYRKYNYHEMHSYSLDAISEYELSERKVPYEGTLDQLYNNDFEKFIAYNRQDVTLLKKLDAKLKFIELTNLIAHANTVGLRSTLGAVAVTDQAVINEAHDQGLVVPDRPQRHPDDFPAAGAYVAVPKTGMHEWIGSMDINSLYPSVIRALNMSTETIVGQVRQTRTSDGIRETLAAGKGVADYWDGRFACCEYESVMARDIGQEEIVDWSDGTTSVMSSAEIYDFIFHSGQPLMLSGNGTIFSYAHKGIIPGLLEHWYAERRELQKKAKEAKTPEEFEYWDKRQLVKKINLNSAYGALLNVGSRFFDPRLGQSTTLCGRLIARHMAGAVNEMFTGTKDHRGDAIIYGDTDSEIGSTVHQTNFGEKTIEDLFLSCAEFWCDGEKEYAYHSNLMVMSYDPETNEPYFGHIDYIYRHKVSKDLYEIEDSLGNTITVTEDHSVMVERNGVLVETKPADILESDILISIKIEESHK